MARLRTNENNPSKDFIIFFKFKEKENPLEKTNELQQWFVTHCLTELTKDKFNDDEITLHAMFRVLDDTCVSMLLHVDFNRFTIDRNFCDHVMHPNIYQLIPSVILAYTTQVPTYLQSVTINGVEQQIMEFWWESMVAKQSPFFSESGKGKDEQPCWIYDKKNKGWYLGKEQSRNFCYWNWVNFKKFHEAYLCLINSNNTSSHSSSHEL